MRLAVLTVAVVVTSALIGAGEAASDQKLENSLLKLDPSELVAQVCDLGGMKALGRDPEYKHADRVMIDAISTPKVVGDKVTGTGGALRNDGKWYRFNYSCTLSPDHMEAVAFSYKVGADIPEEKWADFGLWR